STTSRRRRYTAADGGRECRRSRAPVASTGRRGPDGPAAPALAPGRAGVAARPGVPPPGGWLIARTSLLWVVLVGRRPSGPWPRGPAAQRRTRACPNPRDGAGCRARAGRVHPPVVTVVRSPARCAPPS